MKIVLSIALTFLLLGCSEEKSKTEEKVVDKQVPVTQKAPVVQTTTPPKSVKQVEKVVVPKKTVTQKKVVTSKKVAVVEKKQVPKKAVVSKKSPVVALDGSKLFQKCTACHGMHAEKKALNKSHVIKGWSSVSVIKAINDYKDGSYGSSMKSVMKAQVSKLSQEEVKALAKYISTL